MRHAGVLSGLMGRFDAIVIGAGQAGPSLAVKLAQAGRSVALVERRGLGGTCVNDGCIPTKTLIASARAAWVARGAARFGVVIEGAVRVDMKAVRARKDAVVEDSRQSLRDWTAGTKNLTVIAGHARFETPTTIRVGDERHEADRFFLNVGGRALVPEVFADVPVLTNTSSSWAGATSASSSRRCTGGSGAASPCSRRAIG